jgi:hypothetical protein
MGTEYGREGFVRAFILRFKDVSLGIEEKMS